MNYLIPFSFCVTRSTFLEMLIVFYGNSLQNFLTLYIPKTVAFQVGNDHLKQETVPVLC